MSVSYFTVPPRPAITTRGRGSPVRLRRSPRSKTSTEYFAMWHGGIVLTLADAVVTSERLEMYVNVRLSVLACECVSWYRLSGRESALRPGVGA